MKPSARPGELIPAPGRGQYDRRLPRERRLAEQRSRLLAATAQALASAESASVQDVIAIAGMGRNTFYEYFDDVAHARRAAELDALRRLEAELLAVEARTRMPMERFRALAAAWLDVTEDAPAEQLLALRPLGASGLSTAGAALEAALGRALDTIRASGVKVEREPLRLCAVAATAEAFARVLARGVLTRSSAVGIATDAAPATVPALAAAQRATARAAAMAPPGAVLSAPSTGAKVLAAETPGAPVPERSELERVLVDVAVRLLR